MGAGVAEFVPLGLRDGVFQLCRVEIIPAKPQCAANQQVNADFTDWFEIRYYAHVRSAVLGVGNICVFNLPIVHPMTFKVK